MSGFAKLFNPKGKVWIVALLVGAFHVYLVIFGRDNLRSVNKEKIAMKICPCFG